MLNSLTNLSKKRLKIFEKISTSEISEGNPQNNSLTDGCFDYLNFGQILNDLEKFNSNFSQESMQVNSNLKQRCLDFNLEFFENFNILNIILPSKNLTNNDIYSILSFYGEIARLQVEIKDNIY